MQHLAQLHVLVLGLGESGLAMARWARRSGAARIVVADTRESPPQAMQLATDVPEATLRTGGFDIALLEGINLLLKSPGLSPLDAQLAPLLARADELGIGVRGELSLFATALAELKATRGYAPKVLAITGTNGKTTTTALTALLAERAGARVAMAGNIGPTMLDTLGAALDLEPASAEAPDAAAQAATADAIATSDVPAPDLASVDAPAQEAASPTAAAAPPRWPDAADVDEAPQAAAASNDEDVLAEEATAADDDAVDIGGGPPPHLVPSPPPPPRFEHLPEVWVLELSSFQLDGVTNFEPSAAAVLNVTQDHLDWHGDMAAYAAAKARIYGHAERSQAVMVINHDDSQVEAMIPVPPAPPLGKVGKPLAKSRQPKPVARRVVRFGLGAPEHPGDFGLVVDGGMAWLVRALESDETFSRGKRGAAAAAAEEAEIILQRLMPADALRIRGRHNAANALAALALATAVGLPLAPMLHGLREYRGEPHRVEFLGLVRGVEIYDDSKGTNVGATVAALNGLGSEKAPARLVVILGGDGKGQDFAPLVEPVSRHARAVALIGRDAAAIGAALAATGVPASSHARLEDATRWAFEQAQAGDALLLSPACASLDMFRNYAHRAEVFTQTVRAIGESLGEVSA